MKCKKCPHQTDSAPAMSMDVLLLNSIRALPSLQSAFGNSTKIVFKNFCKIGSVFVIPGDIVQQ